MVLFVNLAAPLVRQALDSLQGRLPDLLEAFNEDDATTVTLAEPAAYVFGAQMPLGKDGFPVVEVAVKTGDTGQFTIGRDAFDHNPALQVVVWHQCAPGDLEATYEMSLGYLSCVASALIPDGQIAPGVEVSNSRGLFYRIDALPADVGADGRATRLNVAVLAQFQLEAVEQFQTVDLAPS